MRVNRRKLLQMMGGAVLRSGAVTVCEVPRQDELSADTGISGVVQDSGLVSRRQVRHLGALGAAIGN